MKIQQTKQKLQTKNKKKNKENFSNYKKNEGKFYEIKITIKKMLLLKGKILQ